MYVQFNCQMTFLFQAIQFSQTVRIQTIQFSISKQFSSIKPIDRDQSDAIIPGQSGPGSNGNERVLCISLITGTSPSDCLESYPGQSLVAWSYPSAKAQSVYSTRNLSDQVSSGLPDFSLYSSRYPKYCNLDGFDSLTLFPIPPVPSPAS